MDTVTYMDESGNPVMLLSDSKPGVIMSLEDATFDVDERALDDKTYIHIRKENGFSITLIMDAKGARGLHNVMFNAMRVRNGLSIVDPDAYINEMIERYNRGEIV